MTDFNNKDVFPDLHHKMSKKIAQLTKVIYHLNTKNDDHEIALESINNQHRSEIETIMSDAANKVNKFKQLLEKRKDSATTDKIMQALVESHDREKQVALNQIDDFQKKAKEKEFRSMKEFKSKALDMKKSFEFTNSSFNDKLNEFASLEKALKSKLSKINSEGNNAVLAKQEELDQYIKNSNKKYNDMLTERLGEQDSMEKRLLKEFDTERNELKNLYSAKIDKIREEASETLKNELARAEKDYSAALKLQKNELLGKMELLLADIEKIKKSESGIRVELGNTILENQDLNKQIARIKKDLDGERSNKSNLENLLNKTETSASNELSSLTSKFSDLSAKYKTLCEDYEREKNKNANLTSEYVNLESDMNNNTMEYKKSLAKFKAEEEVRTKELLKTRQEITILEDKIKEMNNKLQDGSKKLEDETSNLQSLYQSELEMLKKEKDTTEKLLNDSISLLKTKISDLTSTNTKLLQEIDNLNEKIKSIYTTSALELKQIFASNKIDLEMAVDKATSNEISIREKMLTEAKGEFQKYKTMQEGKEKDMENKISILEKDNARLMIQLQELQDGKVKDANEINNKLQARLRDVEILLEKEKGNLIRIKEEYEGREKEFNNKISNLNNEMRDMKLRFENELALAKILHDENLKKELELLEKRMKGEANQLSQSLSNQSEMFIKAKEKELEDKNLTIDILKDKIKNLEADIVAQKNILNKQYEDEMNKNREKEENRIKLLSQARDEEVKALMLQINSSHTSIIEELKNTHMQMIIKIEGDCENRIRLLKEEFNNKIAEINANHLGSLQRQKEELLSIHKENMEKERALKDEERNEALLQAEKKKNEVVHKLNSDHRVEIEGVQGKLDKAMTTVQERDKSISASHIENQNLKREVQYAVMEVVETKRVLQNEFDNTVKRITSQHEREVDGVNNEYKIQIKIINDEMSNAIKQMEDKNSMLRSQLEEMEERYRSRESRPEDVARIAQLEHMLIENDMLIKQQAEEMKFFKLELINREENFNKMFSRSPTVGVMQVIKSNKPPLGFDSINNTSSHGGIKRKGSLGNPSPMPPLNQAIKRSASLVNTINTMRR